jgi:hypothetical protein
MMKTRLLPSVEEKIEQFRKDHRGERPLYILVSPHEQDQLLEEVKQTGGFPAEALVTEYKGSKIVKYDALKEGDIHLTDDLPETSS